MIFLLTALMLAAAPLIAGFDLPLMPGLAERPGAAIAFDQPEGRILEAELEGMVTPADARAYYAAAATGLGWRQIEAPINGPLRFERAGERLTIDLAARTGGTRLHLLIEPARQPAKDKP